MERRRLLDKPSLFTVRPSFFIVPNVEPTKYKIRSCYTTWSSIVPISFHSPLWICTLPSHRWKSGFTKLVDFLSIICYLLTIKKARKNPIKRWPKDLSSFDTNLSLDSLRWCCWRLMLAENYAKNCTLQLQWGKSIWSFPKGVERRGNCSEAKFAAFWTLKAVRYTGQNHERFGQ